MPIPHPSGASSPSRSSSEDLDVKESSPLLPGPSGVAACVSLNVVSRVVGVVLALTVLAVAGYLLLPLVLFVARRCAEGYRRHEFVSHLSKPREQISREFFTDLDALDEVVKGRREFFTDHDGLDSGPSTTTAATRGIVIPSSNSPMMLKNLYASLVALRDGLNSSVPVTISFYGSREPIDPAVQARFVARFRDTSFMDLSTDIVYPEYQMRVDNDNTRYFGFKAKVLALYAAPYDHTLLLDSDSVPLVDPALLFESAAYEKHGNVFWPDRWCEPVELFGELGLGLGARRWADDGDDRDEDGDDTRKDMSSTNETTNETNTKKKKERKKEKEKEKERKIEKKNNRKDVTQTQGLEVDLRGKRQTDSGQVLFDRRRYADVLEYLLFLNAHDEYTYERAYGDKDTYEAAFFLAGKWASFYQVDVGVSVGLGGNGAPMGFLQGMPGPSTARDDDDDDDEGSRRRTSIVFVHRTSEAKRSKLGGAGGVQWVMWETTCEWNEKYWHFFRPLRWYGSGGSGRGWENVGDLENGGFGDGWEKGRVGWNEFDGPV